MKLSADIMDKAQYWAHSTVFDERTRKEVGKLIEAGEESELTDRFYRDLEFGTGGMRGIMGAGTCRMNVYNIRKATQALALYLKQVYPDRDVKVALSFDSRHNSRVYAQAAVEVLAAHGFHSLLTGEMRPVPYLSFMVRHYACQAGICITASHNPPQYNGFKVYWTDGGQLVPPHDKNILTEYRKIQNYEEIPHLPFPQALQDHLVSLVGKELDEAYLVQLDPFKFSSEGRDIKIAYSPLHGTGVFAVPLALERFGFRNVSLVEEQSRPDGNFPTVTSPNPEEPSSLARALDLGSSIKADLVLATDPDSDRLAIVVYERGDWQLLTGNQIGCLLFEYVLASLKRNNKMPIDGLVIKTIVTTDLQKEIADHYGVTCEETLTGFKWIAQRVEAYESGKLSPYKSFICGTEESYGFMGGKFVRDKDAVLACALAADMVAYYKSQGLGLVDVLDQLYLRHQVYQERLETITLPGKQGEEKIAAIMKRLRESPPESIKGLSVESIKDYQTGEIKTFEKGKWVVTDRLDLPTSNVLQFCCKGAKISIRPSGTEPKVKVYVSVFSPLEKEDKASLHLMKVKLDALAGDLVTALGLAKMEG